MIVLPTGRIRNDVFRNISIRFGIADDMFVISNQHFSTIRPAAFNIISPSTILPNKHALFRQQTVTKYNPLHE